MGMNKEQHEGHHLKLFSLDKSCETKSTQGIPSSFQVGLLFVVLHKPLALCLTKEKKTYNAIITQSCKQYKPPRIVHWKEGIIISKCTSYSQ